MFFVFFMFFQFPFLPTLCELSDGFRNKNCCSTRPHQGRRYNCYDYQRLCLENIVALNPLLKITIGNFGILVVTVSH